MARSRRRRSAFWVLALTLTLMPTSRSTGQCNNQPVLIQSSAPVVGDGPECKVYALAELSTDPSFCKWVADTIPQVIEPGSWGQEGAGKYALTYNSTARLLVVSHTPAVQAKVVAFLDGLKKA